MKILNQAAAIGFLLLSVNGYAQSNKSGIYLKLSDYKQKKLSYESDCSVEKEKIRLKDLFNKPFITVVQNGQKTKLMKNEIFGFRNCDNQTFRFFQNHEYQIIETGKIIIYAVDQEVANGKSFNIVHVFHFSTSLDGPITTLTIENLKKAYPGNHKFHDLLDQYFTGNHEISEYDKDRKMYKVNSLLETSLH